MTGPIVLFGGLVHDGTGIAPRQTNVLIVGDRIGEVANFDPPSGAQFVDVSGKIVAPGFIDVHSHSDYTLLLDPRATSSISQGVTTEIVGNCGHGCAPFLNAELGRIAVYGPLDGKGRPPSSIADYLEQLDAIKPAVNVLSFVPNGQLRLATVGFAQRKASFLELNRMESILEEGMDQGAIGLSTGLEYAQESGAEEAEIVALARVAARFGGIYATHTRDRDSGAVEAVEEAIRTAARAEVPLQVSHITPRGDLSDLDACLELVLSARRHGLPVNFDMHTRTFGFTHLKNVVPLRALQGDASLIVQRLSDSRERASFKRSDNLITRCSWRKVVLARSRSLAEYVGLNFEEIGRIRSADPHDIALDILINEAEDITYPMVTLETYSEEHLRRTYLADNCMIGSDATALSPDGPLADEIFHGAYSWASWFWARMVRETKSFDAATAIHRLTALPANAFGIKERGVLKAGNYADIVVFDPVNFTSHATLDSPNRVATGVSDLFVNGVHSLSDGIPTGYRGGRALMHRNV